MVRTNEGGIAYSSVVPVTVSAAGAGTDVEPIIKTEVLPEAVAGQAYNQKIACSDSSAKFTVSYNAGGANDFEKTGLTLSQDGTIFGTPTAAGSYGFTVSASNSAGDAYMTYILTVKEGASGEQATTPTVSAPEKETVQETPADTQLRQQTGEKNENPEPIAWWIPVAIGVAAAGTGVGVAVLLTRKKSSKEV